MDKRKNYYLTIDTETFNGLEQPIVYDIGGVIHDKKGNVYESFSFIVYETYCEMPYLKETAYYKEKMPQYDIDIKKGTRLLKRYYNIKKHIENLCKEYNVKAIIAHNAPFDYRATTTTQRYLTYSKYRYFLPYGIPIWDTMRMALDTLGKQKSYKKWCEENGYIARNRPRVTAEILYRYLIGNNDFIESHTALEDVLIEKEIFAYCMRCHKKMRKNAFNERK